MIQRRIESVISTDVRKKMVLLSGPRQCGKTTLVEDLVRRTKGEYLNWDAIEDRRKIQNMDLDFGRGLWAFDELHKFRRWRGFLKGLYDKYGKKHSLLVTGSARLELYGRGGDSLQGRYFMHHLHPFTLSEIVARPFLGPESMFSLDGAVRREAQEAVISLSKLGGFPEPFLSGSDREADRWRLQYGARLVQEDVRSLENVRDLDRIELLYDRLGAVAGSVLSINSLKEDLEVAFETVRHWIQILEKLDAIFRISPYGPPRIKAVKKEQKLYFWDSARCETEGARFENMIAVHLLRFVHWMADVEGESWDLRYFKHREGHEVDFVLLKQKKPVLAIEAKLTDQHLSPSLRYILERGIVPKAYQVVLSGGVDKMLPPFSNGATCRIVSASRLLSHLP